MVLGGCRSFHVLVLTVCIINRKVPLCTSRRTIEEIGERAFCFHTQWVNTSTDELCAHCLRILTSRLIDDYIDLNYWKYLRATAEYRRKAHENCFILDVTLFEEWIEMGGEV